MKDEVVGIGLLHRTTIKHYIKIGRRMHMANLVAASANIRLVNEDRKSICSVSNVSPTVSAQTAANFVDAIEKIYNNGTCTARMSVVMDIVR